MLILEELKLLEKWNTIRQAFVVGATAYMDQDTRYRNILYSPECSRSYGDYLTSNPKVLELKYRNNLKTPFNGIYFKIQYEQIPSEIRNIDMCCFLKHEMALYREI